ncbi:MAG: TolC family protein, partial [Gammaproteobacteria bacterium]|nr:TolC family protein [Gammaproteobacteria bacterium]
MLLLKGKLRLFIIFSLCTFAAQAEDLWDIYNLAKENDTQFLANTAQWQASKETLNQNKALIMPSLDLSASVSGNRQKTRQPSASAGILNYDSEVYSISLIQPLYNSEYMARIHQAQAVVDQADADFESARLELMVRVAEKYFSVLSAGDNVAFAEAEKKAVERQLEQTQKRFEVGLIAITDVHEAKARYDITVAQEIAARND